MTIKTRTDRENSISAEEFLWDTDGLTEVHGYVSTPILDQLKKRQVKNVLDLGCGNGAFSDTLSKNGFDVTGLDFSLSGIEIAKRKYPNVHFEQHDTLTPLPPEHHAKYDAVTAVEVIEHLLLPRKLLENSFLALNPKGTFIVTTPYHGYLKNLTLALTNKFDDHWHPLRDFGHVKFFSRATITQLFLECGFVDVKIQTVGRIPAMARSMIVMGIKPT